MPAAPKVAIVGAGYAGMAAAVELAAGGAHVTVFEAARQLGGRARRVEHRDTALDTGLHILIGAYRETLRLIELVNPAPAQALLRMALEWHVHGEFHLSTPRLPAPLHLLAGLLRARGLAWSDRRAAIRFLRALRQSRFTLREDTTVPLLLQRHGQSERLNRMLWLPLCVAALNTPPHAASARVFVKVLGASLGAGRAASDLLLSRVDLSALFPDPAAAFVQRHGGRVERGCRVSAIDPLGEGFAVEAGGQRRIFSHVICAIAPHQVNAFLAGISALAQIAESIERLRYQPIYSVWLQYPHPVALPFPMLGFAQGPLHWAFDREALCGQRGLIGAVISASGAHQELSHDELAQSAHRTLSGELGGLSVPLWHRVIAEKRATFLCSPGLERPAQVTPLTNFYLAGDYTAGDYPATIEAAVQSGVVCARHIRECSERAPIR